ncbi:hypothetical protein E2C01_099374 [Portunus trituberculatus]|uniref:Uncharacterized protein n=1 Tax=Portunus trituberculatus TaxID=210409 RepID=A0A5B7KAL8_PORTR|nr:hypothetical protein [Portunus trituberculatus]
MTGDGRPYESLNEEGLKRDYRLHENTYQQGRIEERRCSLREHSITEEIVKKNTAHAQKTKPMKSILQSDRNAWNKRGRLKMKF